MNTNPKTQTTMNFTTISKAKKQTGLSYLGGINISAKMIKNKKISGNYTYIIYLAPASTSGYNVCAYSTPECRNACLATSGRAGMELIAGKTVIQNARIKKTKLFHEEQEFFMNWLVAEMKYYQAKAKKDGYNFSARLNGTSDIDWATIKLNGQNIFQIFPDVVMYDYTKDPSKVINKIPNYHLTFSYSGRNHEVAMQLLKAGFNVAVVFDTKKKQELPKTFNGYSVVDADLTDARFLDKKGVVAGLRFKSLGDKQAMAEALKSVFVVRTNETNENILLTF